MNVFVDADGTQAALTARVAGEPLRRAAVWTPEQLRAMELARAAFAEALRRHGMLPGTVRSLCAQAELYMDRALAASEADAE